ncbi:MAG: hypothetical protein ACO1O6_05115 [Bacteroidota bacterium]
MKDPFEIIEKIKPVETPPFLYTRIMQQIENAGLSRVSRPLAWSLGSACLILCIFSLVICLKTQQANASTDLGTGMDLMPQNSLYHD